MCELDAMMMEWEIQIGLYTSKFVENLGCPCNAIPKPLSHFNAYQSTTTHSTQFFISRS